jgi:hypothetical protein
MQIPRTQTKVLFVLHHKGVHSTCSNAHKYKYDSDTSQCVKKSAHIQLNPTITKRLMHHNSV